MRDDLLACIYMVIAVFILAGNSLTIAAIHKNPKLNTPSNQFIYGLAIADLLVGLGIPYLALLHLIPFRNDGSYETFALKCLLSKLPLFLSCTASAGHLVVISLDRFFSIVRPIQHKVFFTKRKAWFIIAVIWIASSSIAFVPIVFNRREVGDDVDCMIRTVKFEYYAFGLAPMFASFFVAMLVTYVEIYKVAALHTENAKKPIKVITIVVGCFIICWTPFLILLGFILDPQIAQNGPLFTLFLTSQIPPLLNSMFNPLVYAWKLKDFRATFLKIIKSAFRCHNNYVSDQASNTRSASEIGSCTSATVIFQQVE